MMARTLASLAGLDEAKNVLCDRVCLKVVIVDVSAGPGEFYVYNGCLRCLKRLESAGVCVYCKTVFVSLRSYFRLKLLLEDDSSRVWAVAFEAVKDLLRMTPLEFSVVVRRGRAASVFDNIIDRIDDNRNYDRGFYCTLSIVRPVSKYPPYIRINRVEPWIRRKLDVDGEVTSNITRDLVEIIGNAKAGSEKCNVDDHSMPEQSTQSAVL